MIARIARVSSAAAFVLGALACRPELTPEVATALLQTWEPQQPAMVSVPLGDAGHCAEDVDDKSAGCEVFGARCLTERALASLGLIDFSCAPCPDPAACGGYAARVGIALTARGRSEAQVQGSSATFTTARWEFVSVDEVTPVEDGGYRVGFTARWARTAIAQRIDELYAGTAGSDRTFDDSLVIRRDAKSNSWRLPRSDPHGHSSSGSAGGLIWR